MSIWILLPLELHTTACRLCQWSCRVCTYINPGCRQQCAACAALMALSFRAGGNCPPPPAARIFVERTLLEAHTVSIDKECKDECVICLDALDESDTVVQLPCFCETKLHYKCVQPWLEEKHTCPQCRYEFVTDNAEFNLSILPRRMASRLQSRELHPHHGRRCLIPDNEEDLAVSLH